MTGQRRKAFDIKYTRLVYFYWMLHSAQYFGCWGSEGFRCKITNCASGQGERKRADVGPRRFMASETSCRTLVIRHFYIREHTDLPSDAWILLNGINNYSVAHRTLPSCRKLHLERPRCGSGLSRRPGPWTSSVTGMKSILWLSKLLDWWINRSWRIIEILLQIILAKFCGASRVVTNVVG